ncbi:hypothetical protein ACG2F4_17225 [Halalkalibaculum sp. DA3122]|uniref:hypothetical protein n=1 Tax=Halalkalibaculum sp. DA3122 TaxID=3373607 RepID=UPI0037552F5A
MDILVYMTGVGTDMLVKTMKTKYKLDDILQALEGIIVVSRGSKPAKVLRSLDVTIDIKVPEPNTWEEILNALDEHARTSDLTGKK